MEKKHMDDYRNMDNCQNEKQHKSSKLHAIERIQAILDEGSFREIGSGIRNETEAFGLKRGSVPYDGVITGYGTVGNRRVMIYAQDFTVMAGTLGKKHGEKIARVIRLAVENKCPVIGINDSGGARIQEGVDALAGYGDIFSGNILASGFIPQISIIAGNCAGGAAYSPGITDFVFMVEEIGSMYITGPRVIESVFHQKISGSELGSAKIHRKNGTIHFSCRTEQECYAEVRKLLSLIPHYYGDTPCISEKTEEKEKTGRCQAEKRVEDQAENQKKQEESLKISEILPRRREAVYDIKKIIALLADQDSFLEIQKDYAPNMVTGLGRLEGRTTAFVANQPFCMGGVLDVDSSIKAARFIRYCDSFDIPIVTLTDVPGFMPGIDQEEKGMIRNGAKLLYAYGESTVPKITVILRRAYGGAYIAMGSRHLGTDFVYAWPDAEIAVMGEEPAIEILYRRELSGLEASERERRFHELQEKYRDKVMNAKMAVEHGYIDEILRPEETRQRLCDDLRFLGNKRNTGHVIKKHGNIPL